MSKVSHSGTTSVLAATVMLAVVVLVLVAGPAEAAFPGANGKIAFVKENFRQGTSGIFAMNPDGSETDRLGSGYTPSYSADGQKVVFERFSGESEEDFDQDIWVMDADGSDTQQVTSSPAYDHSPSFFPEGDKIAFIRDSRRNGTDIFTINLDGTGLEKITDSAAIYEETLAVSPEGSKIAFSRYNRSSDIWVMNADGTDPQNLTRTGRVDEFGPDWSPDAQKIAFTSYRFNFFVEGGTSAEGREAFAPEALERDARASEEPEEDVEVSVMDADGGNRQDLTSGPAFDAYPAFSPNGTRIAFTRMIFDDRTEKSDLFVMRADGTRKRQLTDTRAFEWGPDWQPIP
jgi:Tol biopolymer transport system component